MLVPRHSVNLVYSMIQGAFLWGDPWDGASKERTQRYTFPPEEKGPLIHCLPLKGTILQGQRLPLNEQSCGSKGSGSNTKRNVFLAGSSSNRGNSCEAQNIAGTSPLLFTMTS